LFEKPGDFEAFEGVLVAALRKKKGRESFTPIFYLKKTPDPFFFPRRQNACQIVATATKILNSR
jgi:hypothetical protein